MKCVGCGGRRSSSCRAAQANRIARASKNRVTISCAWTTCSSAKTHAAANGSRYRTRNRWSSSDAQLEQNIYAAVTHCTWRETRMDELVKQITERTGISEAQA